MCAKNTNYNKNHTNSENFFDSTANYMARLATNFWSCSYLVAMRPNTAPHTQLMGIYRHKYIHMYVHIKRMEFNEMHSIKKAFALPGWLADMHLLKALLSYSSKCKVSDLSAIRAIHVAISPGSSSSNSRAAVDVTSNWINV